MFTILTAKFDIDRNYQSDKGQTVFNIKNKQHHALSGINIYITNRCHEWQENPDRMDENEVFVEY